MLDRDDPDHEDNDYGLSDDDGSQENDEGATTHSSATRQRGRQQGKLLRGVKRVALTLGQKVEVIK